MKRENVSLTPEEARLYEKYSVEQVIKMACYRPISSTDKSDKSKN